MSTICRQLGYSGGATTGARIKVDGRRIWMRKYLALGTACPNDAARIDQCTSYGIGHEGCRPNASESLQIQCEGKF